MNYNDIKIGLFKTQLKNRIEYIEDKNIIIDSSHNEQGVMQLSQVIKNHFPERKIVLVCSVSSTKDIKSMVKHYKQFVSYAYVTQSTHVLSMSAKKLEGQFALAKIDNESCDDIESAIKRAKEMSNKHNNGTIIIVSGSIYMIDEVNKAIEKLYIQQK